MIKLSKRCLELLNEVGGMRFRQPDAASIVWTFGTLSNGVVTGLSAMEPGNWAEDLKDTAVAQSEDGDLLLCSESGQTSILRHDDQKKELLSGTIETWITNAQACGAAPLSTGGNDFPQTILGRWHPKHSPDLGDEIISCLPDIEIRSDGSWIQHCTWPEEMTDRFLGWADPTRPDRLYINYRDERISYIYSALPDGNLMLIGPDSTNQVVYAPVA